MKLPYYIGPAGWSYKDWEGVVYPPSKNKKFHPLSYLIQFFNTIEINSSFYRPPSKETTVKWVHLVEENPQFLFTYKLWQEFTHQPNPALTSEHINLVKSGLDPLIEYNKLGAVLIQFPWSFKFDSKNMEHISAIVNLFESYHPVIEVRHGSWNQPEFFDLLTMHQAGFVNIDQPVIGESLGITNKITSETAYLRLHGRNYKTWFKDSATAASRYDYLYSTSELSEIIGIIQLLIENSPKTFIIFNNHYRGQAIANALQTLCTIGQQPVAVPETLLEHYPALKNIADQRNRQQEQISLF